MKQVAELSGISESYYQMIETGKRGNPLNVDIAKNIATALNFKWTLFYVEIGTKFALPYLDGGENNDKTNPSS